MTQPPLLPSLTAPQLRQPSFAHGASWLHTRECIFESHFSSLILAGSCDRSHGHRDGASSQNVFSPRSVTWLDLSTNVRCSVECPVERSPPSRTEPPPPQVPLTSGSPFGCLHVSQESEGHVQATRQAGVRGEGCRAGVGGGQEPSVGAERWGPASRNGQSPPLSGCWPFDNLIRAAINSLDNGTYAPDHSVDATSNRR